MSENKDNDSNVKFGGRAISQGTFNLLKDGFLYIWESKIMSLLVCLLIAVLFIGIDISTYTASSDKVVLPISEKKVVQPKVNKKEVVKQNLPLSVDIPNKTSVIRIIVTGLQVFFILRAIILILTGQDSDLDKRLTNPGGRKTIP